ncbi:FHA domain-containing protein [Actinophytocola xinjiangensis]|uniref:FHA domain-containing protein n=1 Tax=Actinophytocola xinjiangensis TaxID=485602 RepID=UPI0012B82009|nr:FHA domain-containing protein [Actinophytocola xinjiangensis]
MAGVICAVCGHGNPAGAATCQICGNPLVVAARQETTQAPAVLTCPSCGATVPDPANLVCVECLTTLGAPPGGPSVAFTGWRVALPNPGSVLLGRDPEQSPSAGHLAPHDNVSRRHATVGVEPDGSMWVRDEYSANGTFVNDVPVPAGRTVPVSAGDRVRLASDVEAVVEP